MTLDEQIAEMVAFLTDRLPAFLDATESPIERALLLGMICEARAGGFSEHGIGTTILSENTYPGVMTPGVEVPAAIFERLNVKQRALHAIEIYPQASVKTEEGRTLRVDFVVHAFRGSLKKPLANRQMHLVVECDGHDFHEKTKEQAARDKKRDRDLAELGFRVLRFSGSEIYKEPRAAAAAVLRTVAKCWGLK